MTKKQRKNLIRIVVSACFLVICNLIPSTDVLRAMLFLFTYLIIGYDILIKAVKGIKNGRVFDENFLMAVATIGAIVLAIYKKTGDYNEAIAVMLFYQIGEWFQSYAVGKSRKSIGALMDIRPDYANVDKDGQLVRVSPEAVSVGTCIVIQPGEKIPLDGTVIRGASTLNTAALTGESLPRGVREGNEVISGCINLNGMLTVKTTKEFGESTVSKILDLVENASSRKSKSENFISKFSRIYTPAVCISALALALLPPLFASLFGFDENFGEWVYRALTFLVISCPCALVISVPLSFFAGIGGASREGILVKGSNYLETLSQTKYVVFDKTGTLTEGVFKVTDVHPNDIEEETLIEYAAHAECASSHPISKSLQEAYGKEIDRSRVSNVEEISGHGVVATLDGKEVALGNAALMIMVGADYKECHKDGTVMHIAIDGKYAGHIVASDVIKSDSAEAIAALKSIGIKKTVMLTGDGEAVAEKVAKRLGLDAYFGKLLPPDKVSKLEELLLEKDARERLVFVGDGINDAPVISRADIGIAMGAMGADAAIEAADVVLMDDSPKKIAKAIRIAKKCVGIVRQNVYFAIGVKGVCLLLGALGITNMWLAIFADVGVMVLAILNAMRALRVSKL